MNHRGWVGVDLDGTLALYEGWRGADHIGAPVPRMVERVRRWLAQGLDVRIFTARVGPQKDPREVQIAAQAIEAWCTKHLGRKLPITATKDYGCVEIWDDRAVQVVPNTGMRADRLMEGGVEDSTASGKIDLTALQPGLTMMPLPVGGTWSAQAVTVTPSAPLSVDGALTVSTPPTHRCKLCGALWRLNAPTPVQPDGSWSLVSAKAGPCCDNTAMGEQIEGLTQEV